MSSSVFREGFNYRGTVYRVPDDATGDARHYGAFPNCIILGTLCTINVAPLPDGCLKALDILGFPAFRRHGLAIHVSGLEMHGQKSSGGWIRALGMYSADWAGATGHASGLGCYEPEPAAIVSSELSGWEHVAQYSACNSFVTLEGIFQWAKPFGSFGPEDVLLAINRRRKPGDWKLEGKQHVSAIRRLLELAVGVSNNKILGDDGKIGVAMLERAGRWGYRWHRRES